MPELTPLTTVQIEKCRRFAYLINMPIDERDETLAILCDLAAASACPPPASAEVAALVKRLRDYGNGFGVRSLAIADAIVMLERLSAARAPSDAG